MSNDINEQSLSRFLTKKLRAIMNECSDHISTGSCKDIAEYKKMTGIIEGLALAERELLDYVQRNLER